jgi:transcriptional regulator with XRE-family HTH domain
VYNLPSIGDRLLAERKRKGMKQKHVAAKIGVTAPTLRGYESGYRNPNPDTVAKLAELYGVSIKYLITGSHSDEPTLGTEQDKELSDILDEFTRQMEGRPLSDEEKKQVLNTITEVIWQARDKSNNV